MAKSTPNAKAQNKAQDKAAAANREQQQAQKTPLALLLDEMTMSEQLVRNRNWKIVDNADFDRKIIVEALIDKLYWLKTSRKGHDAYAEQQRENVQTANRRNDGTEIGQFNLRRCIAEAKAANLKKQVFGNMLAQLRGYYAETWGEEYTAYGENEGNIPTQTEKVELPDDIAADLAALGVTPEPTTVANTDGVETTVDVA